MITYVNDEKIEEAEVLEEVERLRPHYEQMAAGNQDTEENEKQLRAWSRENVVERVLMRQAAQRDTDPLEEGAVEKAYAELLEQHGGREKFFERFGLSEEREEEVQGDLAQNLRIERLVNRIATEVPEPTEEDERAFYEEHLEHFTTPETLEASHIVKHMTPESDREAVEAEMQDNLKKLRNNADFGDLAAENSDCPESRGSLGEFPRGQMVEAFEEVVFNLELDEISDVFETEFGFHIAKVHKKTPERVCSFEEAREAITNELPQMLRQKAIESFLDGERAKADIRNEDADIRNEEAEDEATS
jgi:parvulin-like peptidyl-prolyl isomerase